MARLRVLFTGALLASALGFATSSARADESILPATYGGKTLTIKKGDNWILTEKFHQTVIRVGTFNIDGLLDASGFGDAGVKDKDGPGPGGGKGSDMGSSPGGGAGFLGVGGDGTTLVDAGLCTAAMGANGGAMWITATDDFKNKWGSAGGGSGEDRGGDGGGHLVIYATTINLNGVIDASGKTHSHVDGYAGGGSGGIIEIHAWKLIGTGKILAKGGDGAVGGTAALAGGGGAGGIVLLDLVNDSTIAPDVSGGKSDDCGTTGTGADGMVLKTKPAKGCIDADGDGYYPVECNPTNKKPDCDDSDPAIHPGAKEECDGIDNDCNDKIDDIAPGACGPGLICFDAGCHTKHEEMDAGPPVDGGGASPDHIEFEGGCDVTPLATASGFAAILSAMTGLALALRLRRRQKRR